MTRAPSIPVRSRRRAIALAVLFGAGLMVGGGSPAVAQQTALQNLDDRPYDDKLLRLSEILGAIHYLRELCGAAEGQVWRKQMQEIVDSEGTSPIRRAKLVKGFNKGYRGYRRTYRSCTEPAKVSIDRFVDEGGALVDLLLKQTQ